MIRMQADRRIFAAFIGGLAGLSHGMVFEPFETCRETAQVDSIQEWTWVDPSMETPPPYRGLYSVAYQPGTCIPAKDIYMGYWTDKPNIGTFTLRPGTRIVDYVVDFSDSTKATGTTYYTAAGKVDSTENVETVEDEAGRMVKETTRTLFLSKPGYELIRVLMRRGTRPWTQVLQDSIVTNGTGKTIYTKGEANTVTTCVADAKTYTCTPAGTIPEGKLQKQVWYLTGERVDSLSYFDLEGLHIATDKWFWSSRPTTRIAMKSRVHPPRMVDIGSAFDVAGRKVPEPGRARGRSRIVETRKN